MSVQELVLFVREKILLGGPNATKAKGEEPDLFWTGVLTAFLTVVNLFMIFYFLFSDSLFR